MALGEMSLHIDYFYSMSPRVFANLSRGYRRKQDFLSRERWMVARKIMFAALAPHLSKNATEKSILELPWENEEAEGVEINDEFFEEIERIKSDFEAFDKAEKVFEEFVIKK